MGDSWHEYTSREYMKWAPFELYEHHGTMVYVRSDDKGKHWEHCLCASCVLFKPDDREQSCSIANALYALCVKHNIVTPVWECPNFKASDLV